MYHFTIQSVHLYCSGSPITKAFWRDGPHQLGSGAISFMIGLLAKSLLGIDV